MASIFAVLGVHSQNRRNLREANQRNSATPLSAHVLLVDPEDSVRFSVAALLERQGHRISHACCNSDALALLKRSHYDLILTEVCPQDGSEPTLLDHLYVRQPAIPIIVLTGVQEVNVAVDVMRRGAFDYLLKPIDDATLLETVQRALEHKEALQQSRSYQQNLEQVVQARTEMLHLAVEDLEHSYDITLEALGDALDLKDSETEGHSKRVTAYTIALARAMGIPGEHLKVIARGAFLHDIGKMAIPDGILRKPGKLTPDEQEIMREHCERGYQILHKIPFLAESAEIVYSHQEHYNGGGYPRQLQHSDIPIGARIFAIADTLDAITSDRPYRKARSFDEARAEILRCSGTQFDPGIIEVFLKIPNDLWNELRSEINGQNRRFSSFALAEFPSIQP